MNETPQWKKLIRIYAESDQKMSSYDMNELGGLLLAEDIASERFATFEHALSDFKIVSRIADFLINENHDTAEDLLDCIKTCVRLAYAPQIIALIEDEENKIIQDKIASKNP